MAKNNPPSISVNKLGEYVVSRGSRQREILKDRKFPQDYKGMYHKEAAEAVALCLASNLEDLSPLTRTRRALEQRTSEKVGTQRRINSNIDAIEAFDSLLDSIDFFGGAPELGPHSSPKMVRHGVQISVRPEIILRGRGGKTKKELIGAIKVHFSRTRPLNEESAGYVSAIVQEYCREQLATREEVYAPYCFVIDLGSMQVYPGVRSIVQRMKDVEAECRNIPALWASITEDE
jgi:hypothetical protein